MQIVEPAKTIIVYMELLKLGDITLENLKLHFYNSPFFIKSKPIITSLKWLHKHGYVKFDGRHIKLLKKDLESLIVEKIRNSRYVVRPLEKGKHDIRKLHPYELNYAFEMVAYGIGKLDGYTLEL